MSIATFRGGVHPYEGKDLSKDLPIKTVQPKKELVCYEAHIQMFFMLSLSIARARKHKSVTMPKALPCKVSGAFFKTD